MRWVLIVTMRLALTACIGAGVAACSGSEPGSSASSSEPPAVESTPATPSASTKPAEAPSVGRSEPAESSVSKMCAHGVRAGGQTSCPFAEAVRAAFADQDTSSGVPPAKVTAYSPATKQHYNLACVLLAQRSTVECKTGTAVVSFPLSGSGGESSPESATEPEEPSGGQEAEGEEQVGSPSHAGDARFCAEHTCIGDFTSEEGTVVECSDGTFSHAGGISGACSHHGGEARE